MKINETSIFVFIASIVFGLLVSSNLSFHEFTGTTVLSARQYQEAINTRRELYREISDLKEKYYASFDKLEKYQGEDSTSLKVLQDIEEELRINSSLLGSAEVHGEGIKIILNDASWEFEGVIDDPFSRWLRLVHNTDTLFVINSLRNAGAEAIAINGQRILSTSEVYCSGSFLSVNGVKLTAPFYISAIGNKDVMHNYMMVEDGYLRALRYREIQVSIETSGDINIPAYLGHINYKYMSELNK